MAGISRLSIVSDELGIMIRYRFWLTVQHGDQSEALPELWSLTASTITLNAPL
jgi:hypothetical protein